MIGVNGSMSMGPVKAVVTNGQRSPQVWAQMATAKIIGVSDGLPGPIRAQAHDFEAQIHRVIANYIEMALQEERSVAAAKLMENR